jgi:hypothetical protein
MGQENFKICIGPWAKAHNQIPTVCRVDLFACCPTQKESLCGFLCEFLYKLDQLFLLNE